MNTQVKAAITAIDERAWTPISYPNAIWEEAEQPGDGHWVSDAAVTEVPITVFTSRRKADHVTCRLGVRRVRRHQALACDSTEQGELFATYRHHEFITNSTLATIEADQHHRDHAEVALNRPGRTGGSEETHGRKDRLVPASQLLDTVQPDPSR